MRLVCLAILVIFLTSCSAEVSEKTLKGITLTPKSFEGDDFTSFFNQTKDLDIISWAGDWDQLDTKGTEAPVVLTELSQVYDYIPLIEVQFFTQSTGELLRPLSDPVKTKYKDKIVAFAQKYHPDYLGVGIEVNLLPSDDFESFVSFYNEIYAAVKETSPETKIFTVFQLEEMKSDSQWYMIGLFDSDLVVFTTYPSLVYKNPSDMPEDYYSEIASYTNKTIAFSEIGWPSGNGLEEEQSDFIKKFFTLTKNIDTEFFIWSFLYDQDALKPFDSMGLCSKDGKKQSFDAWLSAS
jgi:hypothetical protein